MKTYVYFNILIFLAAMTGIAAYYYYMLVFMSYEWANRAFFMLHGYRIIYMSILGGALVLDLVWYSYSRRVRHFSGLIFLILSLGSVFYCLYCFYLIPADIANISSPPPA